MMHGIAPLIARTRVVVLAIGLVCLAAITVHDLPLTQQRWTEVILWACWLFFLGDWLAGKVIALGTSPRPPLLGGADLNDALTILPVPIAHLMGVMPATAWLLAALWLLKLQPAMAGFALLRRVFALEAKPLASVVLGF